MSSLVFGVKNASGDARALPVLFCLRWVMSFRGNDDIGVYCFVVVSTFKLVFSLKIFEQQKKQTVVFIFYYWRFGTYVNCKLLRCALCDRAPIQERDKLKCRLLEEAWA